MENRLTQAFRIILAIVFIFSAISKLISLRFFDTLVAELFLGKAYYEHPGALWLTQLLTRILISAELLLGIAVLQNRWLKKITLPAIFLMLAVFTVHLFYVSFGLMADGKSFRAAFLEGNCGCFGDVLPMDNFESIIKNIIAMAMTAYVWKQWKNRKPFSLHPLVLPVVVGLVTFGSLVLTIKNYQPAGSITTYHYDETKDDEETSKNTTISDTIIVDTINTQDSDIESDKNKKATPESPQKKPQQTSTTTKSRPKTQLGHYTEFSDGVTANLEKGRKIVCMFSLSCGHCQDSYQELCALSKEANIPPMYLLCYGSDFELHHFFSQAGCRHPHHIIDSKADFDRLLDGNDFPVIMVVEDGVTQASWNLDTYHIDRVREHFGIDKKEEKKETDGLKIEKQPSWMDY